ncbi:hypothetical protein Rs2_07270 [Raphanus sativus]|nr:hypothetical protein Rs2_07270 [Raphanus sativus]
MLGQRSMGQLWARSMWIGLDCMNRALIPYVDFDHSLLIWHIATELCYQEEPSTKDTNRVISKMLSDYMMYLLIMQPKLMSGVADIGKVRFRDTLAEAERFYKKMSIRNSRSAKLTSVRKDPFGGQ